LIASGVAFALIGTICHDSFHDMLKKGTFLTHFSEYKPRCSENGTQAEASMLTLLCASSSSSISLTFKAGLTADLEKLVMYFVMIFKSSPPDSLVGLDIDAGDVDSILNRFFSKVLVSSILMNDVRLRHDPCDAINDVESIKKGWEL